ncbi:MAG TPA: DUF4249 domain-containing protein [Puia sp.]|uniref:DUF4249 domain-containing protein n=1 Tax=Puia sp. TaxID=2045100 RepID=UPI002CAD5127|nr:DUF4249 domain-containing protein [Puia sp.]HVU95180.1 DUF4249 domain-containing protein [Puia sp.]
MKTGISFLLIAIISILGCKQSYLPPAIANPPNYLVVEAFLNTNAGENTVIRLSHTVKLDTPLISPEQGATVTVEGADNTLYKFDESGNGAYTASLSTLNYNTSYRLHIVTATGKQYASDYFPLIASPPIDSISFKRMDDDDHKGVTVYANTHDPQNKTRFYRWEYEETWEFHSAYFANIQYVPRGMTANYSPNTISTCWHNDNSTSIILGTSTQLASDVIHEAPLLQIPLNSQQISVRYSILVKQYALPQAAFDWWQILQKNSEQIGSIFGVQPSANKGNMHCLTDTAEQVLGFVSGGSVQSLRTFITIDQVRPWFYDPECADYKVPPIPDSIAFYYSIGYLPWKADFNPPLTHMAPGRCVDCTLSGTNQRPYWW